MPEVKIGDYKLIEMSGTWFLLGEDDRIAGTLLPQRDGSWRCRLPRGGVATFRPPDGVPDPASWVARQIV
jgi:hypothetical protein